MQPALGLLLDLSRQVRELLLVELSLAQVELRERGRSIPSSLTAVVTGLILLPVGVVLFLRRFGAPLDLSFLIVGLVLLAGGALALWWGANRLKPSRLAPVKSMSQISSLLGEF
jgi:Putative Actinobacterial Holin-X, holin superfamily III